MKNLKFLLPAALMLIAFSSCEMKEKSADFLAKGNDKQNDVWLVNEASTPVSDVEEVTPYIIPGANQGGNRTCADVANAFSTTFALCGDKLDYMGNNQFNGNFPEGLNVTVDGIYVSFNAEDCIEINGDFFEVGAVIVKGTNSANVYYYAAGTLHDEGLTAPGEKPMVSNLTFCFVPCEPDEPEYIIFYKGEIVGNMLSGENLRGGARTPGYYEFDPDNLPSSWKVYFKGDLTKEIGTIKIGNFDEDTDIEVIVDNLTEPGMKFYNGQGLYVGKLIDFTGLNFTQRWDFPQGEKQDQVIFEDVLP